MNNNEMQRNKHLRFLSLPKKEAAQVKKSICSLIDAMRFKREELGMSQEQLAESLEMSIGMIKGIEQKVRTPSLVTLIRMVTALKMSISLGPAKYIAYSGNDAMQKPP